MDEKFFDDLGDAVCDLFLNEVLDINNCYERLCVYSVSDDTDGVEEEKTRILEDLDKVVGSVNCIKKLLEQI